MNQQLLVIVLAFCVSIFFTLIGCDRTNFLRVKSIGFEQSQTDSLVWVGVIDSNLEMSLSSYAITGGKTISESAPLHFRVTIRNLSDDTIRYDYSDAFVMHGSGVKKELYIVEYSGKFEAGGRHVRYSDFFADRQFVVAPSDTISMHFQSERTEERARIQEVELHLGAYSIGTDVTSSKISAIKLSQ